jgi:pseudouridine-5'-phosphate glycosidase
VQTSSQFSRDGGSQFCTIAILGGGKDIGVNPQQLRLQTLAEYQLNLGVYKRHIAAQIPHLFRDNDEVIVNNVTI